MLLGCITKGFFSIWCKKRKEKRNWFTQQNCCKVSDYQLGPELKKNDIFYFFKQKNKTKTKPVLVTNLRSLALIWNRRKFGWGNTHRDSGESNGWTTGPLGNIRLLLWSFHHRLGNSRTVTKTRRVTWLVSNRVLKSLFKLQNHTKNNS